MLCAWELGEWHQSEARGGSREQGLEEVRDARG